MRKTKTSKPGFTLAETFLCVFLVGTIAALVTSIIYRKSADVTMKSELKQAYSMLEQATNQILADKNDQFGNLVGAFTNSSVSIYQEYKKYLNVAQYCVPGTPLGSNGCWGTNTKWLNGTTTTDWYTSNPRVVLANGVSITFIADGSNATNTPNCASNWFGQLTGTNTVCANIYFDTNGPAEPNTLGKDIFILWLLKDGIVPLGYGGDIHNPNTECAATGSSCAALYLKQ